MPEPLRVSPAVLEEMKRLEAQTGFPQETALLYAARLTDALFREEPPRIDKKEEGRVLPFPFKKAIKRK